VIATEITVYRAASIALVLAASAFVRAPTHEPRTLSVRVENVVEVETASELDVPSEGVAVQEPAPPRGGRWQGTCHEGERGWPDMPITLAITATADDRLQATGTLAFVGRRTRATLQGGVLDDRFILHGEMKEIGGIDTVWRLEVNGRFKGPNRIVGRFVEVYPRDLGGSAVMCTFDWRR